MMKKKNIHGIKKKTYRAIVIEYSVLVQVFTGGKSTSFKNKKIK